MGCSHSSARCEHSTDVLMYGTPALSERDAWDIAMAWSEQLRGCVQLEADSEELCSSIIPVFEWVTFVFQRWNNKGCLEIADQPQAAAYARAATIAWFALSCCEGYSGRENPGFWKRVFYELLYPKDLPSYEERMYSPPDPRQLPITDAIRFFSRPDRPFPRVKLRRGRNDDDAIIASTFLGTMAHEDQERDGKLQQILAKLEPFMRKLDVMRGVPVQLDVDDHLKAKHAKLVRNIPKGGESVSPTTVSAASAMNFPQLYLRSLKLIDKYALDMESLRLLIPPSDVEVIVGGSLKSFVRDHRLCRSLFDQLHDASSVKGRWRVTDVHVRQNDEVSYSRFCVLCSALPHLQSVNSVTMPTTMANYRFGTVTPVLVASSEWSWLGYAIFHPDAASTSGLKSLEFDLDRSISIDVAALANMALGNNLLGGTNAGYLEGLISSGTEATIEGFQNDASTLYTFAAESWVALIVSSPEALDNQELVCVVIPGFGCGLIHRDNIIETRTRGAGASCIRSLSVENYTEEPVEDATDETLLGLLRVLGRRLTSLRFKKSNHVSASRVGAILSLCPSLRGLRIHHDGSFWADEMLAMDVPRLEELELTVHGRYSPVRWSHAYREDMAFYDRWGGYPVTPEWERGPVRPLQELKPSCLPHLKALHVTSARDGAYEQHEPILASFLTKQAGLQYLHWSRDWCETSKSWADAPAYRENEGTREFLARIPAKQHLTLGPLHVKCRFAFLSVISDKSTQNSVGQLGKDVVALIFQYSSSSVRREIFMNQFRHSGYRF